MHLVVQLRSQLVPARFRKHSNVVKLGLASVDAKCSDLRSPSKTPQSSAKIIVAPLTVRCSLRCIIYWIFFRTCYGTTATFSAKVVPLYTSIPLYIRFYNTASMTGPILPFNNHASSAALLATRHVFAALKEAMVARAIKMSTCESGYVFFLLKGEGS